MATTPSITTRAPMTFGQLSVLRSMQWEGQVVGTTNDIYAVFTAEGPDVTVAELQEVWHALVHSNPSLRTVFDWRAQPYQIPLPSQPATLPVHPLPGKDPENEAMGVAMQLAGRPVDPRVDFPSAAAILTRDGAPVGLAIAVHHLALDRMGLVALEAQFIARMTGRDPVRPVTPVELSTIQQSDVDWNERTLRYWSRKWLGFTSDRGPDSDRPRLTGELASVAAGAALTEVAHNLRISEQAVVLGLAYLCLAKAREVPSVTVGLICSNRFSADTESVISSMVSLVPLRINVDYRQASSTWLRQIYSDAMEAYSYGSFSVDHLTDRLTVDGHDDCDPLNFNNWFNWVGDIQQPPPPWSPAWDGLDWLASGRVEGPSFYLTAAHRDALHVMLKTKDDVVTPEQTADILLGVEGSILDLLQRPDIELGSLSTTSMRSPNLEDMSKAADSASQRARHK